jgi:hypothetical protein
MPRRVEFTRRSWLVSTIFDGIRDFADAGEWPTTKNPTPILDSARSADAGRHVGFATGARVFRDYDVSAIDAAVESLGRAPTKADAPDRGNNSPRARRTLLHRGQSAGSAGSMPVEASAGNANLGSEVSGAQRFGFPSKERKKRRCRRCLGTGSGQTP